MKVTVITAFPEFFRAFFETSIVGRAVERGLLEVDVVDLRDYGEGSYSKIDDYSFGGKGGMVLMAEPLTLALEGLQGDPYVVYPSPQGVSLTQETVETLFSKGDVVIVCGHYEGIDERFVSSRVDLELSVGDYVLTGGELPAMVIIDAVSRLVPGVVGKGRSVEEDSFFKGMLDTPHFTRPSSWRGQDVPDVLLSGNDGAIEDWRRREAVRRTLERRPDLLSRSGLLGYMDKNAFLMLPLSEVSSPWEIRSIARACSFYGVSRLLLPVEDRDTRDSVRSLVLSEDLGALVKLFPSVAKALRWVSDKEKAIPYVVGVNSSNSMGLSWLEIKREILEVSRPVIFMAGGDDKDCDVTMRPVAGDDRSRSALPVQNAISVVLDRFFGWR
ncbi:MULTISPECIES: tRNA (guanosine(37)-N1)-methyltransferase TrmD [Dethiosulfovibrio]|uniref:tRNA (guanine-N(1)-)-methyltransferase n=2 Tax=Dethiosulfovibrio TaxID=47054 RepID=A0ABS9EJK2_9BACT|nr:MULTISPECIES: tRNA (guanosine(37)-N1)-methyltransferase TrmD [Dethiosulfovibrio]MCF4112919.1 tRNA (guanosine(37)-N1)-methyltransferase TrmD [Dethiosulfovibrio russensis]MCF4141383.1 tRNA (guanosine(37)-N1)-methyltransferase TrmD [Dethiosulfovibrio marinus]MCF4144338.1 tRNA (guanosine(37)-N1)-methyltransferase TrmD [Dethiosulfovibrio acidaminovorans]